MVIRSELSLFSFNNKIQIQIKIMTKIGCGLISKIEETLQLFRQLSGAGRREKERNNKGVRKVMAPLSTICCQSG